MVNFNAVSQYAGRLFKALTVLGISASLVMTTELVSAQSVGISNTTAITPSTNSLLDIRFQGLANDPGKGLLIPRVSYQQRTTAPFLNGLNNLGTNATERGMLVYQYDDNAIPFNPKGFYHWNGTAWVRILDASSGGGWLTDGNAASGTDFLGTTNGEPLRINTNGILRYSISASTGSLLAHQNGTATAPVISWNADDNTGIYRVADDVLGFSTAGTERLRIAADGNVGIGVLAADPVLEKLQVTGNIIFSRAADRIISVQQGPDVNGPASLGNKLTIQAGSAFNGAHNGPGGDLVLQAGSANSGSGAHKGDVIIVGGGNSFNGGGGVDGDIIFESGAVAPSTTNVERMRLFSTGSLRVNSLGVGANYVVRADVNGLLSAVDPTTMGFGTVTSITAGTGLSGGVITSSGTIAIANDGVTSAMILDGAVTNADLANMNGYTVKVRNDAAAGVPSDFAVGTQSVLGRNSAGFVSISAGTNGHVLRRTGGSIGFSPMPITDLSGTNNSVYYVNNTGAVTALALGAAGTVLQSTGATSAPSFVTPSSLNANLTFSTGLTGTSATYNGSTAVTLGMANMAALSVKGNAINAAAAPTDIAAASDFQVLRRSGTAIGFGSINLASSNAVTGILPIANGGTGSGSQNWVDLTTAQTAAGEKTWTNLGTFNGGVRAANGSAAAPTVTFVGSATSGLYQQAANAVGVATAGVERVRVTNLGMGILGGVPTATQALVVVGKVKSTGINETSDGRLKKNVAPIANGLEKVLSMNGVTYDWRRDEFPDRNFLAGKQYGLIAQELERVIPELVDTDEEGWKSIEYSHIVPVLIEAIKEQQAIIAGQQQEITSLQSMKDELNTLKASIELLNEHLKTSQK